MKNKLAARIASIFLLLIGISLNIIAQDTVSVKTDTLKISGGTTDQLFTGYTLRSKEQLTGSVSEVRNDKLTVFPSDNFIKQMQGLVPGLTVIGSGQPGSIPKFYIRGITSLSGAPPLIIVDGIPFKNISLINPNDIESVAVLKDAAATAIYGARALNGVIVIQTRKADHGFHVQYKASVGWQFPGKGTGDDLLNSKEYADLQWLVYKNDKYSEIHPLYGSSSNASPVMPVWAGNTDWYDAITKPEVMQIHDLSVSKGGDNAKVYLGASYYDQNGIILNTDTKRYIIRLNSELSLFKKHLKIGENIQVASRSGRYTDNNSGTNNPILNGPYRSQPIIPVYITVPMTGLTHNFQAGDYGGSGMAFRLGNSTNAVADQIRNKDNIDEDQLLAGNAYIDLTIVNGLTWRTLAGGTWEKTRMTDYALSTYENSENLQSSSLTKSESELKSWIVTSFLDLEKKFGKNHISALAGIEQLKSNISKYERYTTSIPASDWKEGTGYDLVPSPLSGYFGSLGYSFDNKYFLDAAVRSDNSRIYPAFSIAWCLSNEDFIKKIDWLNLLKIRASYGRTGNMNTGWEYVTTKDIGFESGFFNNHIGLSFDWFSRQTDDLYWIAEIPSVGETSGRSINDGMMSNKGYEASVNFNKSKGSMKFNADIILSAYRNMIGNIGGSLVNPANYFYQGGTRIGQLVRQQGGQIVNSFYGYKVVGLFTDAADVVNSPLQEGAEPGFFKFADLNGDKVIDPKDRTFLGDPNPDFTAGLNFDISYKGVDLGLMLYLSKGNEIYNFTRWFTDFWPSFQGEKSKQLLYDSWTESNRTATVPKASNHSNFSSNTQSTSYYIEDGSFLKCRSLQLGYSFDKKIISKIHVSKLRLYIQAANLFTLTKYSGLDPEIGDYADVFGIDYGNYPNVRELLFGVQLEL